MSLRLVIRPALAVLLCLGLGSCASPTLQIDGDTAFSSALKLSVTKPPGWRFVNYRELRAAQPTFGSTNQHLNYLLYQNSSAPAVLIVREPRDRADPSAAISIDRYPLGDAHFASAVQVASSFIASYQTVLPQVKIIVPPMKLKVGKSDFTYCRIQYPLEFADGNSVKIERQFWVWAFPLTATVVSASCESLDLPVLQKVIDQTVASIKFQP